MRFHPNDVLKRSFIVTAIAVSPFSRSPLSSLSRNVARVIARAKNQCSLESSSFCRNYDPKIARHLSRHLHAKHFISLICSDKNTRRVHMSFVKKELNELYYAHTNYL